MNNSPEQIYSEFTAAARHKEGLGKRGLNEQARMNERFFVGDQWHGAALGADRPLVRHNVIKRIGDYKIAQLTARPLRVKYSAEGVSLTREDSERIKASRLELSGKSVLPAANLTATEDLPLMLSALTSYRETVAERLGLTATVEQALRDAYIKGTGIVYTYFDPAAKTGLFADRKGGTAVLGDIVCERVSVEDVYFGDPYCNTLQNQPYIILTEDKNPADFIRFALSCGLPRETVERAAENEGGKVRIYTKLFKQAAAEGEVRVFAVQTTKNLTLRPEFPLGIASYPLAVFRWEERDRSAYGDSEVTYIIPNQIAINRMITAGVWSAMSSGMPIMVVNGDLVTEDITNEPGQIIRVFGSPEELASAVRFVTPPDYSAGYTAAANSLIYNTLTQCGANEAALGDMDANNTSAIVALREAAGEHLGPMKRRYQGFIADISRIWAEFFFAMYGKRGLKICDGETVWFYPFNAALYKDLLISVSVEESVDKSEHASFELMKELLKSGDISADEFVRQAPEGVFDEKGSDEN